MNLHEYQSKRLFADYGIAVPRGIPADSSDAAVKAAEELGGDLWVVKAQVHAGGRGKAGGVKLARTLDEVREFADGMLGIQLVTHQSGPEGLPVNVVYVEEGSEIDRELYLSMLVDREVSRVSFIASAAGGMDIEKVAEETPEQIFSVTIAPDVGLQDFQARQLAFGLELDKKQMRQFGDLLKKPVMSSLLTARSTLMAAHCFASRRLPNYAIYHRKMRRSARLLSTISTMYRSTAILPAWLTVPDLRWRRWT